MNAGIETALRTACADVGIVYRDVPPDGQWYPTDVDGDQRGKGDARIKLFPDGDGGIVANWKGETRPFFVSASRKLSTAEIAARERKLHEAEAERKRLQVDARDRTAELLNVDGDPATHPYALTKRVPLGPLLKRGSWPQRGWTDALLVPIYQPDGRVWSIEAINVDGKRNSLKDGRKRGGFHPFGEIIGASKVLLAEGIANAAVGAAYDGSPAVAALSAGNLAVVASWVREVAAPGAELIFLADNDVRDDGTPNTGVEAAMAAAALVGGRVVIPELGGMKCDFWDLWDQRGPEAVQQALASARATKVQTPQPATPSPAAVVRDWPEPRLIRAAQHPVPEFDAEALLPPSLRDWVMDEAERMPCPPDFIAAAAIVALGATIGARCAIKPKARDSWLVVPNLWGGVVALPSAKKSPAIAAAMAPLDRLAARAQEAHREDLEAFETDRLVSEARCEAIKDSIKSEAKKPDGGKVQEKADELRRFKAEVQQPPTLRRYRTNDATVEKLGELLRDNPSGLLVLRDELVGLLASWDREGREGDRSFFLEAWNGTGSFDTDRIGRGSIQIPNLCLSIFGGIQPDKLTEYLEQAAHALGNDGTLQRFQVLVYPDSRPWEWRDRAPNQQARDTAFRLFELLADFDPVEWGAIPADEATRFPHFRFADDAQQVFIEWLHDLQRERIPLELADGHPLIAQHLAKYEKLFAALALILHLADCAATGQRGPVTAAAALRAAAWCECLEAHARRCFGLLADEGLRAAQALATHIERGVLANGFTARDVRRNGWRYLASDAAVRAALDWLEDEGWLRAEAFGGTGPGSGRKTDRYWINPKTLEMGTRGTAKTANRTLMAVTAVPHPGVSGDLKGAAHG